MFTREIETYTDGSVTIIGDFYHIGYAYVQTGGKRRFCGYTRVCKNDTTYKDAVATAELLAVEKAIEHGLTNIFLDHPDVYNFVRNKYKSTTFTFFCKKSNKAHRLSVLYKKHLNASGQLIKPPLYMAILEL